MLAARAFEAAYPDVSVAVADARFLKPLDEEMIQQIARESDIMITVEEGSVGGFGSHVQHFLCNNGFLDNVSMFERCSILSVCLFVCLFTSSTILVLGHVAIEKYGDSRHLDRTRTTEGSV